MSAFAQASSTKAHKPVDYRRDAEQRAASVNRKARLNQVREQEAGSGRRGQRNSRDFMSSIGYDFGQDDE